MRLLDGAGPRGLGGIAPVRGPYIRPLLETRRQPSRRTSGRARGRAGSRTRPIATRASCATGSATTSCRSWWRASTPTSSEWLGRGGRAGARAGRGARDGGARPIAGAAGPRGVRRHRPARPRARARCPASSAPRSCARRRPRSGGGGAQRAAGERALRRVLDPVPAARRPARAGCVCERSGRWMRVGAAPRRRPARARLVRCRASWPCPSWARGCRSAASSVPTAGRPPATADRVAVRRRPSSRPPHRAGAPAGRPVPAVGRPGRAAAQDLPDRRGRAALGAVARAAARGRTARSSGSPGFAAVARRRSPTTPGVSSR